MMNNRYLFYFVAIIVLALLRTPCMGLSIKHHAVDVKQDRTLKNLFSKAYGKGAKCLSYEKLDTLDSGDGLRGVYLTNMRINDVDVANQFIIIENDSCYIFNESDVFGELNYPFVLRRFFMMSDVAKMEEMRTISYLNCLTQFMHSHYIQQCQMNGSDVITFGHFLQADDLNKLTKYYLIALSASELWDAAQLMEQGVTFKEKVHMVSDVMERTVLNGPKAIAFSYWLCDNLAGYDDRKEDLTILQTDNGILLNNIYYVNPVLYPQNMSGIV